MGERTTRAAGRKENDTKLTFMLPIEMENQKGELVLTENGWDSKNIRKEIDKGCISIKAGSYIIDPKTGKRTIVKDDKKVEKPKRKEETSIEH